MSSFVSDEELFSHFEEACSLGAGTIKSVSLQPEAASRLLPLFESALKRRFDVDLEMAHSLCKEIVSGRKAMLYATGRLSISDKGALFEGSPLLLPDDSRGQFPWVHNAITLLRLDRLERQVEQALAAADPTTVVRLKEYLARAYDAAGYFEQALHIRAQIAALPLPPDHPMANLEEAVVRGSEGKPLTRMGTYFQGLDTGSVKMGTLHASKMDLVRSGGEAVPKPYLWVDLRLTHWEREKMTQRLQFLQEHERTLGLMTGLPVRFETGAKVQIPEFNEEKNLYQEQSGWSDDATKIEFPGMGTIFIHTNPNVHSFYNRVDIRMPCDRNGDAKGARNLHTMLSLLGLGTTLCPSRPEDEMTMKIFILLHAFFPALSYGMERDPANYSLSPQQLREIICAAEPGAEPVLRKYLDEHPELLVKEELYSGRDTYRITDMGDLIRPTARGLLFGAASSACEGLDWEEDPDGANARFKDIAHTYAQHLKAGIAQYSNREEILCRGRGTAGSSPWDDSRVGGMDSVFTRLFPRAMLNKVDLKADEMPFCEDGLRFLLDADVMGYASTYAHEKDRCGARADADLSPKGAVPSPTPYYSQRPSLIDFARAMQRNGEKDAMRAEAGIRGWQTRKGKPSAISNEVMIRDFVPTKFLRSILVPRPVMKKILIDELRQAGLIQQRDSVEYVVLPGCAKPIDEFIYVGDVPRDEMWANPK